MEREFLLRTGLLNQTVYAGIQSDDCVVWKKVPGGYQNFSLCNHTCVMEVRGQPTGGNYTCNASFVFAGKARALFAPRETIVGWTTSIAAAHKLAREMFFADHFNHYCEEFHIPPSWAKVIKTELTDPKKKVEVNRFGGSPEMLRDCPGIIADCKQAGLVVNLTTPGRRFMTDKQFAIDVARDPPQVLAMSFDDIDPQEIKRIAQMDLDAIRSEWNTIPKHHGQRQKAFEGLYTAKLMKEMGVSMKIPFNVVIHPGNIGHINEILTTLTQCVPDSLANPFPAQSFEGESPGWTIDSLSALRTHVKQFINGTLNGRLGVTRRLAYYIALEAAFRKWEKKEPKRLAMFMSGIGAWDFTLRPGAYRYPQIGKNQDVCDLPFDELPHPGGHIGCFWNPVLGFSTHVNGNTEELAETILTGMVKRGKELRQAKGLAYVQTSNIMPRLMFDMVSTELGLPFELVPMYLEARAGYCGF